MSFFFSKDNRYFKTNKTSTPMLTPSGVDDYYAALKIQRWWRKSKETILFEDVYFRQSNSNSSTSNSSNSSRASENSLHVNTSGLRKRKLDELECLEAETTSSCEASCEASCEDTEQDTEQDTENSEDYTDEDTEDDETRVVTVNDNTFLLDFFSSLFSFFMRLFGLN